MTAVSSSVSAHARRLRTTGFSTRAVGIWGQWEERFGDPAPPVGIRDFILKTRDAAAAAGQTFHGFAFGPFPGTGVDPIRDAEPAHAEFADFVVSQGYRLFDWAGWFWHLPGPLGSEADGRTWIDEIRKHVQMIKFYLRHGVLAPAPAVRYDLIQPPGEKAEQIRRAAPLIREAALIVNGETGGSLSQEPEFGHALHRPFDVLDLHDAVGLPVAAHSITFDFAHARNLAVWGMKAPDDSQLFNDDGQIARLWGTRTGRIHFAGTAKGETTAGAHASTALHAEPDWELSEGMSAAITSVHCTEIAVLDNCMMPIARQLACLGESLRQMGAVTNNRGLPSY